VFFFKDKENIYHPLKTYLYDGLDILSDGTSSFLNGAGIDAPLQVDDKSYLQDHLGSASQLLDAVTGNSKARYDYKSYGALEGNPPALKTLLTYTGREDDGTGLYYYRARYYDPEAEIFISQDPLGDAQRYVGGNPLSFTDPLGLEPFNSAYCPLGVVYDTGGNPTCLPILPLFDTGALVRGFLSACGITATESADSAIKFNSARSAHIFRNAVGHVNPVSPRVRMAYTKLFENVASKSANFRPDFPLPNSAKEAGIKAFTQAYKNGKQVWVFVDRQGHIVNAGVNSIGGLR
jgi:RHS repeat-associated protein